jgi:receptor-type tyrosine-protein phosphatase N
MITFGGEEGNDRGLEADGNFAPINFNVDDYMVPLSVNQDQQDMTSFNKRKRGSNSDTTDVGNADDEEELLYVPVYSDPDREFLNRHKFSTVSKRSMDTSQNDEPQEEVEEFRETYEYPIMVSVDGKEVPSVHYTRHEAEEPSGLRDDVDMYEPTLRENKDTSGLYASDKDYDYEEDLGNTNSEEDDLTVSGEDEHDNENSLGSFTFNRKERLDVKKPGPFFPNSENNFFFKKLLDPEDEKIERKRPDTSNKNLNDVEQAAILGDPFGPRRSNYSADGKGQIEVEMPLQVLNPHPKKRNLADKLPEPEQKEFVHLMMKKRFDKWQDGIGLVDFLADEFGVPRHALDKPRIDSHHVQFKVDPNPQNIDAEKMAYDLENDIILKKRISTQLGLDVSEAAAGDRNDYDISKFPATSISNLLYIALVATSTLAILILSAAVLVLTKHCVRRRREHAALNKLHKQDVLESERGKVQEEYKQLCRDWSKKNTTNTVQPDSTSKSSLVSEGSKSGNQPTSVTIKKLQGQDSKGSDRSSTSSWGEEPTSTNMDISTGHMVLAYMEDHLKNKQRLEQEWVALCGYEAEPCATTLAFKTENKKKNRYPDKLPYDHNRVILNAVLNGSNSDYINASSVTDHDPRNPSYIVTQGPLAQTVADFWQMIWEQGCVVIVMLSRLQDNGYQLCHRYWPEEGSEQYHIFEVHLVSEHVWCDDYLVRSVYLKNTRTGETRTVTQFHFRSWPAQSVPSSTKALLEFRRKVNKSYRGRSAPICVHCSDGVGRAGTYVLIDMVLNRMAKGCKEIDIAATLEHIRDQRSGMVQTRPQFEFCLMAVAEEVHAILKALLP